VGGIVADVKQIELSVTYHLRKKAAVVPRHPQKAEQTFFLQCQRPLYKLFGWPAIVPAEDENIGLFQAHGAQVSFKKIFHQQAGPRVALDGDNHPIAPALSAKVADGPLHAGSVPSGAQIKIIASSVKSFLECFSRCAVAGRQPQRPDV
jgi:hypothetical protein